MRRPFVVLVLLAAFAAFATACSSGDRPELASATKDQVTKEGKMGIHDEVVIGNGLSGHPVFIGTTVLDAGPITAITARVSNRGVEDFPGGAISVTLESAGVKYRELQDHLLPPIKSGERYLVKWYFNVDGNSLTDATLTANDAVWTGDFNTLVKAIPPPSR